MKIMMTIRAMTEADWPQVAQIYSEGISTGNATFETVIPTYEKWSAEHSEKCRLVAIVEGSVAGWCVLSPVSGRYVYRGVAEVSIYIGEQYRGQKVGMRLLEALTEESEKEGYWTLQSVIQEENVASLGLHHKCGFRTVGLRERIGRDSTGKWRNTLFLERRSTKVD